MVAILPIFEAQETSQANVIFFHGLNGDAHATWGAKRRGEIDDHFWPSWLEADIKGLSIYSVSYCAPISDFYGRAPHYFCEASEIFKLMLTTRVCRRGLCI